MPDSKPAAVKPTVEKKQSTEAQKEARRKRDAARRKKNAASNGKAKAAPKKRAAKKAEPGEQPDYAIRPSRRDRRRAGEEVNG
jgi:hypothetical protein